ncbi:MAG: hypothetical protein V1661_02800 [bacterium]
MNNTGKIQVKEILEKYPWIIEENQNCVISPDADGMLCGLFMSHFFNWKIVGYYDNGKNLILQKGLKAEDCIFLDTEIRRPNIKSIGHHISLFRKQDSEDVLKGYINCFNPNNLRDRTLKEKFGGKYPMATIHLLISIVGSVKKIEFSDQSFFVVLQADGTINRFLDKYSENLRDWLVYLGAEDNGHVLNKMLDRETTLLKINREYVDYVQKFVKTKKDKIPISERGNLTFSSFNKNKDKFSEECAAVMGNYLNFLSENTGWQYKKDSWLINDFKLYEFTKKIVTPGVGNYKKALEENFLSLAITSTLEMNYTIESPNALP